MDSGTPDIQPDVVAATAAHQPGSEEHSREVAEHARGDHDGRPSFLRELFLGSFRPELIDPFPPVPTERPEFVEYFKRLDTFMREEVDSDAIDATGEYPEHVLNGLREMGAFGMKIPTQYGGLGFTQVEYDRVMQMLGTRDGNIAVLLSAHQSIGAPQPLKLFGSQMLKEKYLPRLAKGAISAFALTEPGVGSDPASLACTAELSEDGSEYVLNGDKLWCTNGTFAEVIVVMARDPQSHRISAFIVETAWPGVSTVHRCRFMGLRAIQNGVIRFENVRVPKDHLIGEEGKGLKYALETLNAGRLALPASAVGTSRLCLNICRQWANERVQWGRPVGKHEAVAHMLADMASKTFAQQAVSELASALADDGGYDIRLEAAAAKEWNTCVSWKIIDDAVQIRGGRGYEQATSLAGRGELPIPMERVMRDSRINRLIEGSSEIMHLFIAREAVDKHLRVAGALIDPKVGLFKKALALPKIGLFYAGWYTKRWLGWGRWPRFSQYGPLAGHMRFIERNSRRMARNIFHGMVRFGPKLQHKQAFLFRLVDVGLELYAMSATVIKARSLRAAGHPSADEAEELADMFCRDARRKIAGWFRALWRNDDSRKYAIARRVLDGGHEWLEAGDMPDYGANADAGSAQRGISRVL